MATKKNTFAGMGLGDDFSDDDVQQKQTTKKSKNTKLESAPKVGGREVKYTKLNPQQAVADGFEISTNDRAQTAPRGGRGGRGGNRGGADGERGRGGRGGRGGDRGRGGRGGRGGPRPATAGRGGREAAVQRVDEEGNPIKDERRGNREHRGRPGKHEGKDREDGTGRARRERKEGGERNYRKKDQSEANTEGAETAEATAPVEEEKVPEVKIEYETIGQSIEDFNAQRAANIRQAGQARESEGIKGAKVTSQNVNKQETTKVLDRNAYANHNIVAGQGANLMGFGAVRNDDDDEPAGRGGRGGRGRGGRGGRGGSDRPEGGQRRANPKQALKKTEEDFPTL